MLNKKLKVILVTETYPPDINGVSNSLNEIVNLIKYDVDLMILRPEEDKYSLKIQKNLKEVFFPFISFSFYKEIKLGIPLIQRIYESFYAFKPDIVHIITQGPLGFFTLLIAKHFKIPVIADYRTNFDEYLKFYNLEIFKELLKKYLYIFHSQCDLNLVPTKETKIKLLQEGYKKVEILSRGINIELFHPNNYNENIRKKLNIKKNDIFVLYVGRIAPEKNLEFLCNIYKHLSKKYKKLKLVMVGDGPIKEELEKKYPEIIFVGKLTGKSLASFYATADIMVCPSKTETFGNVFYEAFASGLPIIGYDYAGAKIFKHKRNALLIPIQNKNESFYWLKYLIKIHKKENIQFLKTNLLKDLNRKIKFLSWKFIANKLLKYYKSVYFENIKQKQENVS